MCIRDSTYTGSGMNKEVHYTPMVIQINKSTGPQDDKTPIDIQQTVTFTLHPDNGDRICRFLQKRNQNNLQTT